MTPSREKLVTSSVLLLGVGVVVVAGITLYPSLRERYWIWKLESGTEEESTEAATALGELDSVKALPVLIDTLQAAIDRSGHYWFVVGPKSVFAFRPLGPNSSLGPNVGVGTSVG